MASYQSDKRKERPHRTEYVTFRVTLDEKKFIHSEAKRMGHSPSDYCRLRCLKQQVINNSDAARKERRIFINLANNVNQIARRINTEGANPRTVAELEWLLDEIRKLKKS